MFVVTCFYFSFIHSVLPHLFQQGQRDQGEGGLGKFSRLAKKWVLGLFEFLGGSD